MIHHCTGGGEKLYLERESREISGAEKQGNLLELGVARTGIYEV